MRLGVTGRSRTGTSGFTAHGSSIELRPHPSARTVWSRWQVSNLRPRDPKSRALPSAPHRAETGTAGGNPQRALRVARSVLPMGIAGKAREHRPAPYQDAALPLSCARSICIGSPTWPRTTDLLVNSQALCHLRYRGNELVPRDRLERPTRGVEAGCSRPLS